MQTVAKRGMAKRKAATCHATNGIRAITKGSPQSGGSRALRASLLATALLGVYGTAGASNTSYSAGPGVTVNVPDSVVDNTGTTSVITANGAGAKITFANTSVVINWDGANTSNTSNAALQAANGGNITITGGTVNTSNNHDSTQNNVRKQGLQAIDGGTIDASNITINTIGGKSPGVQAYRTPTNPTAGDTPTVVNLNNVTINTNGPEYSVGIRADHKGASVVGVNTNITTTGTSSNSYGVEVDDGGTVQLTNGTITTSGDLASGVRAYTGSGGTFGPGVATLTGTTINTTGNHASGLIVGDSSEPTAGTINATNVAITTTGTNATGLQANYGEIHSSGSTITTSGSSAHAAEALTGASITLTGDTLTANGGGYGLHVNGAGSSITANDATITTKTGTYGVFAENGGHISLTGGSVANEGTAVARMAIYATGAGTSVATQDVAITNTASGGGTGSLSNVVSAANQASVTLNGGSVSSKGASYGRGILSTANASVAANGVDTSTIGTLSNAVHAYSGRQLLTDNTPDTPSIALNGGTVSTSGDNSYGLFSQNNGASISTTGNTTITTTGANSFGAVAYNGGALNLNGATVTTSGAGADGIAVNELLGAQTPGSVHTPNYASTLALSNSSVTSQQANGIFLGKGSTGTINNSNISAAQYGMVIQDGANAAVTGGSVASTGASSSAVHLQDNATASFTGTTLNSAGATFTSVFTQAGQAQGITLGNGTNATSNNGTLLGVTRSGGGTDGTVTLVLQDGSFAQGNVYDPTGANQVTVTKGANAHWAGLVVDSTTHTVDPASNPTQTDFSQGGNVVIGSSTPVTFTGTTNVGGDFSGATGGSSTFSGSTTITGNLVGASGSTTTFTGSANVGSVTGGSGSSINFTGSSTNIQGDVSGNQGTQITFSKGGSTTIGGSVSLSGSGTSTHGGTVDNPVLLHGNATVSNGATLGGNITSDGSLGGSGGTVGPGNSVGVQSYASSAGFTGNYFAEVNAAGKSDLLIIRSGNFDLSGIGLTVGQENRNGGYVLNHKYTIIQTPGGSVVNKFASAGLDSSFAGTLVRLDPVIYDPQDVQVTLSVDNSAVSNKRAGLSTNQNATLDGVLSVAGKNTAADAALQSTDTGGVLNQLSGEVHASTQAALLNTGDLMVRTLTDRMRGNLGAPMTAGSPVAAAGALPAGAMPQSSALPVWAQVVGNWQTLKGGDDGAARSKLSLGGLYLGGDTQVGDGWRVGAALGYTNGRLDVDDRDSRSDLNSYSAAIYGGKSWQTAKGRINFLAGAGYTRNNIDTRRNVNVGGNQALKASYHADSTQLFTELGYALPMGRSSSIEPYARVTWINQRAQGFDESGGAAALHGDSNTDSLTTLTLGLRGATELAVGAHTARLTGGLGWRHAGGDVNPKTSLSFIQGSGASFNVAGAPIAKDAAVLDLGAEMAVGKSTAVGLSYNGQYGAGNSDSAGTLYLKMRF